MEYVNDRGAFADFPFDEVLAAFREHYPEMMTPQAGRDGDDAWG